MYRSRFSLLRHYLEESGQLHASAALSPGKEPPVPIGWECGWAQLPVWIWRSLEIDKASVGPGSIPDATILRSSERGPLNLVSTIEELLEIKSSGSGLENRGYGRRDSSR
jgi:hypothetical protein